MAVMMVGGAINRKLPHSGLDPYSLPSHGCHSNLESEFQVTNPNCSKHNLGITIIKLSECIALWGECKQVLLCGRCWCTFVCKWHNSKHAVLRRLCSNQQSLADPESSQSALAILSRLRSSSLSLAQPKSSQPASTLGLCRRRA